MQNNPYLDSVAKLRDSVFKPEEMGFLGDLYKTNQQDYRDRLTKLEYDNEDNIAMWEDRFARSQKAYLDRYKQNLQMMADRGVNIDTNFVANATTQAELDSLGFNTAKPTKGEVRVGYRQGGHRTFDYYQVYDKEGNRRSWEDIMNHSGKSVTGQYFRFGAEAQKMFDYQFSKDDFNENIARYDTLLAKEQAALDERNAKAKEKYLADKQEKLQSVQASGYRGATYVEKPK